MATLVLPVALVFCTLAGLSRGTFRIHQHPSTQELLVDTLLKQYETHRSKDVKPAGLTNVTVDMEPNRIDGVHNRVLSMVVWNAISWNDHRLAWENDHDGEAVDVIYIPVEQIWTPDLEIFSNDAPLTPLIRKLQAVVTSEGNVLIVPAAKIRVFCDDYAEDIEEGLYNCTFRFGSWVYDAAMIDLEPKSDHLITSYLLETAWTIESSSVIRKETFYTCCPGTPYVDLRVSLTLRHHEDLGIIFT